MTRQEILKDWEWLFNNVSATLHCFDNEEEITDFVSCKIESVIATRQEVDVEGTLFDLCVIFVSILRNFHLVRLMRWIKITLRYLL